MDTLHTVLRSINANRLGERKSNTTTGQREHLTVFREFLRHLDRAQKRNPEASKSAKRRPRRKR